MTWDFAEGNSFSVSTGNFMRQVNLIVEVIGNALAATAAATALQADAQKQDVSAAKLVSTDPPYYDNIGYADLSDFFYVWLRRSLKTVFLGLGYGERGEEVGEDCLQRSAQPHVEEVRKVGIPDVVVVGRIG